MDAAKRMPPIVIQRKDNWSKIVEILDINDVKVVKANATKHGIKIFPRTPADYNKITGFRNKNDSTFTMFKDLKGQGIDDYEVKKMSNRKTRQPLAIFLLKTKSTNSKTESKPKKKNKEPG